MSEEGIKKIAREEMLETIKNKLDSSMIFTYINNLEQENKQLKERYERLKQEHIDTITRNEEKQQRIDKATKLIKENVYIDYYGVATFRSQKCVNELLETLGDKE